MALYMTPGGQCLLRSCSQLRSSTLYFRQSIGPQRSPSCASLLGSTAFPSPPALPCPALLQCFMQLPFSPESGTWFGEAHILEIVDSHTQVVYHKGWRPSGLLGRLCAPRDIVLQRTWRQDEDGTYIVMYQSTRHGRAREAQGSGPFAPVRATVGRG